MVKRARSVQQHLNTSPGLRALLGRAQQQQQLLARVRSLLQPPVDRHLSAVVFDCGRLVLFADSPVWSSRLRFFSRQLSARLRQELNMTADSIVVRVAIADYRKQRRGGQPCRALSAANASLIRSVAADISDPALSQALNRLSRHGR